MYAFVGALIDIVHALLMMGWVLGLPLLFWHRWPSITYSYSIFSISFMLLSQGSRLLLGECFLTTWAQYFWKRSAAHYEYNEWLTVRFAKIVFHATPSHRTIVLLSELLVFITAVGVFFTLRSKKKNTLCS